MRVEGLGLRVARLDAGGVGSEAKSFRGLMSLVVILVLWASDCKCCTQRTQYPLLKEYTLNHIRDPIVI